MSGGWTYPSNQGISLSGRYVSLKGTGVQASEEGPVVKYRPSGNSFSYSGYENGWFSYTGYSKVVINSKEPYPHGKNVISTHAIERGSNHGRPFGRIFPPFVGVLAQVGCPWCRG